MKPTVLIDIGKDGKILNLFTSSKMNVVIIDHSKSSVDDNITKESVVKPIVHTDPVDGGDMRADLVIANHYNAGDHFIKHILGENSNLLK